MSLPSLPNDGNKGEQAMSYDLMVFEKRGVPTVQSDFLNWYDQKMERETEREICDATESMQKFFDSVRRIFPFPILLRSSLMM